MPFYEYQCKSCGHHLEAMQKINDKPLKKCPECGKSQLTRLMSAPVFRLKGAGWYETDFKGDQDNKRNLADAPDSEAANDDKATAPDAKADAKAEGKTEAGAKEAGGGKDAGATDGGVKAGGSKDGGGKGGSGGSGGSGGGKDGAKPAVKATSPESSKKPVGGMSKRGAAAPAARPSPKKAVKKVVKKSAGKSKGRR